MPKQIRPAAIAIASLAPVALADLDHVYHDSADRPDYAFFSQDFEGLPVGEVLDRVDFSNGFFAMVETENNITNKVFAHHDGYGAVPAEGENAWKLAGGSVDFEFNTPVRALEFMYSDLEWTDLTFEFDNGDSFVFNDSNSRDPKLLGYVADDGDWFTGLTLTWVGTQNDGIGFDNFGIAAVPGPSSTAMAALGLMLIPHRRRSR